MLLSVNATANPTAEWVAQQITEAFPCDQTPRCLLRDGDGVYGTIFSRRLPAIGIRDRPVAPHSPWQNGYVERYIGSIGRECLDHDVILGEAHLRRALYEYAKYCNAARTLLVLARIIHDGWRAWSKPLI